MKAIRNFSLLATLFSLALASLAALAANTYDVGLHDAGTPNGAKVVGMVVVSTNASQAVVVKTVTKMSATKSVTNQIYSVTCSGGYAQSTDTKFIPPNAQILVTGERVTLFAE